MVLAQRLPEPLSVREVQSRFRDNFQARFFRYVPHAEPWLRCNLKIRKLGLKYAARYIDSRGRTSLFCVTAATEIPAKTSSGLLLSLSPSSIHHHRNSSTLQPYDQFLHKFPSPLLGTAKATTITAPTSSGPYSQIFIRSSSVPSRASLTVPQPTLETSTD